MEGGGVKGIALIGPVSRLERAGYRFQRCAGASAGAIAAALVAAGMPDAVRQETMRSLDYARFRDGTLLDHFGLPGKLVEAVLEKGIYKGDFFHGWIRDRLAEWGVHTFADLRDDDAGSSLPPERRYRLVVMVSDVSCGKLLRLPWDYPGYGLDPDARPVADAVRASMSVPFFFRPMRLPHLENDRESYLVDGGMLSNYPIDVFDRTDGREPRWPTFGVKLSGVPGPTEVAHRVDGVVSLSLAMLHTMMDFHDRMHIDDPAALARTMFVDTGHVGTLDFGLDRAAQRLLFDNGYAAADRFLEGWSWSAYLAGRDARTDETAEVRRQSG
jgi:NTE family protein